MSIHILPKILLENNRARLNPARRSATSSGDAGARSAAAARAAVPNLSKAHISPQGAQDKPKVTYWVGGNLMKVTKGKIHAINKGGGKRNQVGDFSRASRRRLIYSVARVERCQPGHFLTVTWPKDFPEDPKIWKRKLDTLFKRMSRHFPRASGFWRLEPQERGAPHFHLMIYGLPTVPIKALVNWFAQNWYEIVGSGDVLHLLWHLGKLGKGNRPCIQAMRSHRGAMSYTSKYIAKLPDGKSPSWCHPGRWWGVFNAAALPLAGMVVIEATYGEAAKIMRLARRKMNRKGLGGLMSLHLLCNAEYWFDNWDKMT